ncbi:hypothetical protein EYF80_043989 [Liparis tanakae]|uniref:Uncharacterized protein n=1 Tax=Liparis tanakae TaxID=230148 RepID=A0A4Z2FXU9_9TELE|nr:hypothetical protein EYF80_043989 [Liparis tanakae]
MYRLERSACWLGPSLAASSTATPALVKRDVPLPFSPDLVPETRAAEHQVVALVVPGVQGGVGAVSAHPLLAQLLLRAAGRPVHAAAAAALIGGEGGSGGCGGGGGGRGSGSRVLAFRPGLPTVDDLIEGLGGGPPSSPFPPSSASEPALDVSPSTFTLRSFRNIDSPPVSDFDRLFKCFSRSFSRLAGLPLTGPRAPSGRSSAASCFVGATVSSSVSFSGAGLR